jgi:hypothetical protein
MLPSLQIEKKAGEKTLKDPHYGEKAFYSSCVSKDHKVCAINKEICAIIMDLFVANKKEEALAVYKQMGSEFTNAVEALIRHISSERERRSNYHRPVVF